MRACVLRQGNFFLQDLEASPRGRDNGRHLQELPATSSRDWWNPVERAGQREIRIESRAQGGSGTDAGVPARRRREMAAAVSGKLSRLGQGGCCSLESCGVMRRSPVWAP